jgi:hypothetical protein
MIALINNSKLKGIKILLMRISGKSKAVINKQVNNNLIKINRENKQN